MEADGGTTGPGRVGEAYHSESVCALLAQFLIKELLFTLNPVFNAVLARELYVGTVL